MIGGTSPYANVSTEATDDDALTILNNTASNPSVFWVPEAVCIIPGNIMTPDEGMVVAQAVTEQGLPMELISEGDFHAGGRKFKGVIYFDVCITNPEYVFAHLSGQT